MRNRSLLGQHIEGLGSIKQAWYQVHLQVQGQQANGHTVPLGDAKSIGVRDARTAAPPIRAVCRHEFGQRVDIIRAKDNTCLNNTNLGSVTAVNGEKPRIEGLLLQLTEKILPPHRIWISENVCYYPPHRIHPGKTRSAPPPNGCWPVRLWLSRQQRREQTQLSRNEHVQMVKKEDQVGPHQK